MLVDSHTHVYMRHYDTDRDAVIRRAVASGVGTLLSVGVDIASSKDCIELAARHREVYATVGFHPHDASGLDAGSLSALEALARQPKVVAIGEIGLDFYRNLSPRDVQLNAFRRQLDLASQLGLPVVIHDRDAHDEVLSIVGEWVGENAAAAKRLRGVVHCFSGDWAFAERCQSYGLMISLAGTVTYPQATGLSEIARRMPLERLLVETDSPFLTPHPHRGKRNEPCNVSLVANKIAELRGIGLEEVARATSHNASALFDLDLPEEGRTPPA